ncbi:MAG: PulJ/GspJ family protein [Armatimonadota bacterium]
MHGKLARQYKRTGRASLSAHARGFTLIEVLVVMAILVILFGLLFAPMMAGMDMASAGRGQARLQDTVRLAAEQMRRELAAAIYVYPPPTYITTSGPVTDYSQLVFVPAATDSNGDPITPRQPRTHTNGEYLVTRYYVRPPAVSVDQSYNENNPFVLVRQLGLYRENVATGRYDFGSLDASNNFVVGLAMSENAITPTENYDIPASSTICLDDGRMELGYVAECPVDGSTNLLYLHDTVKFRPERIVGEALVPSENNTVYKSRHGNWMGMPNNGTVPLGNIDLSATAPELQPRIVDYRWDGAGGYRNIALDSFTSGIRSNIALRWNSTNGTVQIGNWRTVVIHVDCSSDPAAGQFWPLTIDGTDSYNGSGSMAGTATAPVTPIYPAAPTADDYAMPIAYELHPELSDATGAQAKIVPGSTRVMALTTGGGDARRGQWTRIDGNPPESSLGNYEYAEVLQANQWSGTILFNRYTPPSPKPFIDPLLPATRPTAYDLYITYYYRRNFDPASNRDDVIFADYSTGEIINITLIPQRYTELEPYKDGAPNLVLPPDLPAGGVPVRTQAVVSNARY